MLDTYVYNSVAFDTSNGAVLDLFYLTEDGSRNILRLYNFDIWYLICRFPGMEDDAFKKWVRKHQSSGVAIRFRDDLRDNSTFMFDNKILYAEVIGNSPKLLKQSHKKYVSEARKYYRNLSIENLSPWDRLLYDNMEDPFRYTNYVLNIDDIKYFLSTTYKIPAIGGLKVDSSGISNTYVYSNETPQLHMKFSKIQSFDCKHNENIMKRLVFDQNINFMRHLTLLTYDLETYSQKTDIPEKDKIIMNIGIGVFNILSQKPVYKACLCVKDFTPSDKEDLKENIVSEVPSSFPIIAKSTKHRRYVVKNEMCGGNDDLTDYIIFNNERDMLMMFMRIIIQTRPNYFGGFNNYGYDDPYLWNRLKLYDFQTLFLSQLFSAYDVECRARSEEEHQSARSRQQIGTHELLTKQTTPRYETFQIKIDSMAYPNNSTFKGNYTVSVDVYKILLASDAKLYTQLGKGNLKSMLQTNRVKNPYNGAELDK